MVRKHWKLSLNSKFLVQIQSRQIRFRIFYYQSTFSFNFRIDFFLKDKMEKLNMSQKHERTPAIIDIKLRHYHESVEPITEASTCQVFEAKDRNSHQKHSIRILDDEKEFCNKNCHSTATGFIKELFHLQCSCPGSVLVNTFNISSNNEGGKRIVCATLPNSPKDSIQHSELPISVFEKTKVSKTDVAPKKVSRFEGNISMGNDSFLYYSNSILLITNIEAYFDYLGWILKL